MATARHPAAIARRQEVVLSEQVARNTVAPQMSVQFYQNMIDKGWRRSGDYMYRPDMARTCCPQYTIRLDAIAFKPNKKQKQVVNRWNRFVSSGEMPGEAKSGESADVKGKGKAPDQSSWADTLRQSEHGHAAVKQRHLFETEFVPAKATRETFELYRKYQVAIHKDPPEKVSMRGFQRFLCDSPLGGKPIAYKGMQPKHLPDKYGSYHYLYKIDRKIIGISVIDILPSCISSVYFIWDPDYAWASLGKLSALFEIAIARDMHQAGVESLEWLYMGYWIANCVKMRYKSEYSPSFLLDPGTLVFHALSSKLDKELQADPRGYRPFSQLEQALDLESKDHNGQAPRFQKDALGPDTDMTEDTDLSDEDEDEDLVGFPKPPPPGFSDPTAISQNDLDGLLVMLKGGRAGKSRVVPFGALQFVNQQGTCGIIRELVLAVGQEHMAVGTSLDGMRDKGILHFG